MASTSCKVCRCFNRNAVKRLQINKHALFPTAEHVKWLSGLHKYASDLFNHISIYKVTPYGPSQREDDGKVKHHSLKRYTVQPVTDDEEYRGQGSSTYIIKPWFDLARRNASPLHLSEMNQEANPPSSGYRLWRKQEEHRFMLH